MNFAGIRIIESINVTQPGTPITHRRSWRARLFSRPWRPWVATWIEIPQVPSVVMAGNVIFAHPNVVRQLETMRGRVGNGYIDVSHL